MTVLLCEFTGDDRARARELLVQTAARSMGLPAAALRVDHDPSGRPRLSADAGPAISAGPSSWDAPAVSVSYTDGVAALGLTGHAPIGVDVEILRPLPALALARRWLTDSETAWLGALAADQRSAAFLWLWTQKEAIGKARGRGLRAGGLRQPLCLPEPWPGLPEPWAGLPERGLGADADGTRFVPVSGDADLMVATPPVRSPWLLAVACGPGVQTAQARHRTGLGPRPRLWPRSLEVRMVSLPVR